jgi:SHS2 domain-containing protein
MVTGDGFEELEHMADWSLRIWGATMAELLTAATRGMLALMGVDVLRPNSGARPVEIASDDRESLLVAWLDDVLFNLETRHVIPAEVALEAGDDWLRATIVEAPSPETHNPIKAVTFHDLEVVESAAGLEARLVFDV